MSDLRQRTVNQLARMSSEITGYRFALVDADGEPREPELAIIAGKLYALAKAANAAGVALSSCHPRAHMSARGVADEAARMADAFDSSVAAVVLERWGGWSAVIAENARDLHEAALARWPRRRREV